MRKINNKPFLTSTSLRQIKSYKTFTLSRAYRGETYFWGLLPQRGDVLTFTLEPPIKLKG